MEKEIKNKKKKITKKEFKKRMLKFMFVSILVLAGIAISLHTYVNEEKNIYEKIGSMSPYSISIKDSYFVEGYGLSQYVSLLKSGDTKAAYEMLTDEYKKVVNYNEYSKKIEEINFETFNSKQIKTKAPGTYVANVEYEKNGVKTEEQYLLYLNQINSKIITISPDKFIYSFNNMKFKMDKIQLILDNCEVYIDSVKMKVKLKNTSWFDTMTFTDIGVGYNNSANKTESIDITLAPGEEREIEVVYDTNYYVPNNIKLKRELDDETVRTYTFYFEDEK